MPYPIYISIENKLNKWIFEQNESSITIPYHIKTYGSYGSGKSVQKILYSNRFRAMNYHIKKYHLSKLYSLNEIINLENTKFLECVSDFILVPKDNQKIMIDEKEEIYFEILLGNKEERADDENRKSGENTSNNTAKYICKLSKKGKSSIQCLNTFLEKIENEYQDEIVNKTVQMVFEYKKSIQCNEDENHMFIFSETPFITNKSFDNIFFEEKEKYIDFIGPFMRKGIEEEKEKEDIQKQYEKSGNPFKSVILLYGPPGCGKSSLIKSTIKQTGRHCILVSWSKIKTCSDFVSLFRPIKINNRVYNQDELILVFEDFDANDNDVIKIRKGLKEKKEEKEEKDIIALKNRMSNKKESIMDWPHPSKIDDELTLEYILNVLDGIVELNNSIVFFTTNDIDIIDPALKRSGRINYILNMKRASKKIMKEMLAYYFSVPINRINSKYSKEINKIPEYKIAYSDISEICNQSKTVEESLQKIKGICHI